MDTAIGPDDAKFTCEPFVCRKATGDLRIDHRPIVRVHARGEGCVAAVELAGRESPQFLVPPGPGDVAVRHVPVERAHVCSVQRQAQPFLALLQGHYGFGARVEHCIELDANPVDLGGTGWHRSLQHATLPD